MRLAPVAGKEIGAAEKEFADFAINGDGAVGGAVFDDDAGERHTDGTGTTFAEEGVREVHEGFAHAVALEDGVAVEGAEVFEDLGGKGCRTGDEQAHALADGLSDGGGPFEHADIHGGYAEEDGGRELPHPSGGLVVSEAFCQAEEAAANEPGVEAIAEAVDVEQRQSQQ